jgi:hypothetical protein
MINYKKMTDRKISIYEWLEEFQHYSEREVKKYSVLLKKLAAFSKNNSLPSQANVLVVGGGGCELEHSIISSLGLTNVNLYAVDVNKPRIQEISPISKIHWIPSHFEKESITSFSIKADVLICIAASRYFHNASEMYTSMLKTLNPGALVIIDFYELPPLRQSITNFMREWLKNEWHEDSELAIKKLGELAQISRSLSHKLGDKQINLNLGIKEIGINSGAVGLQQLIYESIFPFWFDSDASDTEISAQLAWSFLCESNDNSIITIERFARKNTIDINTIYSITRDTHALIGIMPSNSTLPQ